MAFPMKLASRAAERAAPRARACRRHSCELWRFLLLSWLLLMANASADLAQLRVLSGWTVAYAAAMFLTYPAMYLAPVAALLLVLDRALPSWSAAPGGALAPGALARRPLARRAIVRGSEALLCVLAVALTAALQLLVFADAQVLRLYGYHLNGFVWNLLLTPGGIESLGAGSSTRLAVAGLAAVAVAAQAALLWTAFRSARLSAFCARVFGRRARAGIVAGLLLLSAFERVTYGISDAAHYPPVLTAAATFPFYQPLRMHRVARALGFAAERGRAVKLHVDEVNLRYPLAPLHRAPGSRDWNIVWLVSESLRADMLDPEIMPETSAFAAQALDFRRHYSAGNGTRMGMFGLFYGLYGSYWFAFLDELRGPVLFDVLLDAGYDVEAFTSARFTFPEFDQTIFARFPSARLHEGDPALQGWENDRANVSRLLDSLDARPVSRPFFRFMFFESPHARYHFPPESVIRTPYLEDLNYATMDLPADIELIRNRSINACHHLDSQLGRVLDGLRERGLLDSTIVVVTGDHGEEFLEKGRWGHHSSFSEEQTRTPLVLSVPGLEPARIDTLSSHLDVVPTLLARLGITNPPGDFSLGRDLLAAGSPPRTDTVIADWDRLACVDGESKAIFPVNPSGFAACTVTTVDDAPVDDPGPWLDSHRDVLARVMKDLARFGK
jgi:uncharacterized protein